MSTLGLTPKAINVPLWGYEANGASDMAVDAR